MQHEIWDKFIFFFFLDFCDLDHVHIITGTLTSSSVGLAHTQIQLTLLNTFLSACACLSVIPTHVTTVVVICMSNAAAIRCPSDRSWATVSLQVGVSTCTRDKSTCQNTSELMATPGRARAKKKTTTEETGSSLSFEISVYYERRSWKLQLRLKIMYGRTLDINQWLLAISYNYNFEESLRRRIIKRIARDPRSTWPPSQNCSATSSGVTLHRLGSIWAYATRIDPSNSLQWSPTARIVKRK